MSYVYRLLIAMILAGAIGDYFSDGTQDPGDVAYYTGVIFLALFLWITL